MIYAGLAVGSAQLHRFVEYARIVRCLTPLMSLIAGLAIADAIRRCPLKSAVRLGIGLGIIALASQHLWTPLSQWFPESFFAQAKAIAWKAPESE